MFFAAPVCAVRLAACVWAEGGTRYSDKWGHHLVREVANSKWNV